MQGLMDLSQPIAVNAEFAEIYEKGSRAKKSALTDLERTRMINFWVGHVRYASLAYFQYERGVIDQEQLESVSIFVAERIRRSPYFKETWDRNSLLFSTSRFLNTSFR